MSRTQTAKTTFDRIRAGTAGWVAIGDFVDDWRRSGTSGPRIPTPSWAMSRRYVLAQPSFLLSGEALRMHQLVETPAASTVRNIFGGNRILSRG